MTKGQIRGKKSLREIDFLNAQARGSREELSIELSTPSRTGAPEVFQKLSGGRLANQQLS
jgi:hypothetical protein